MLKKPPVPKLWDSLKKYLSSLEPVLSKSQFEQTQKSVSNFLKEDGEGNNLQQLLKHFSNSRENWVTELWIDDMYLNNPLPLPVNSSPFCLFPRQNFSTNLDMFRFAAKIINFSFQFKQKIDDSSLTQDFGTSLTRHEAYCMETYKHFFRACRIPGKQKDQLFINQNKDNHIIIASNNQFFKININQEKINEGNLIGQLSLIWFLSHELENKSHPIGLLTTENRRTWAFLREHLNKCSINKESLHILETSCFILCLDESCFEKMQNFQKNSNKYIDMDTSFMAHQIIHGGCHELNSGNRYYDKFLQIIIGKDGIFGIIFEHSGSDGVNVIRFCDELIEYLKQRSNDVNQDSKRKEINQFTTHESNSLQLNQSIFKLEWKIDNLIEQSLEEAGKKINKLANDLDLHNFCFNEFGKKFIKEEKLSPDAFVQIALQLTYYKIYRRLTSSYESCSLRRYKKGRVDNIRANTMEVLTWAQALCDDAFQTTEMKRLELFVNAIKKQCEITKYTIEGHGPDNHLMGLKEIAKQNDQSIPLLFKEEAYREFLNFRLSTSQLVYKNLLLLGYGPVVSDGYGCSYRLTDTSITFCITSFHSSPKTNSVNFALCLKESLLQMHEICLKIKNI